MLRRELQENVAQPPRLGGHGGRLSLQRQVDAHLQGQQAEDRRRAAEEAVHARGRTIGVGEVERRRVAHPSGQWRDQSVLMALGDIEEGRRPGAAVQILIAAADRQVRARAVQVDLGDAGGMAEVPERQGSDGMGGRVHRRHVAQLR